jgi:hypothetical protein
MYIKVIVYFITRSMLQLSPESKRKEACQLHPCDHEVARSPGSFRHQPLKSLLFATESLHWLVDAMASWVFSPTHREDLYRIQGLLDRYLRNLTVVLPLCEGDTHRKGTGQRNVAAKEKGGTVCTLPHQMFLCEHKMNL